MTKYPRGRDIAVNWTLDLGGSAVDLAACDLLFEYHTGAGSKSVPRSAYTIYNNVLSWTFHGEDQIAYGVYGLRLVAASGSEEYVFHLEGAFEIIHGEVSDEEQTLPLESSVETEQEPAEEEEEQETGTPVYVSSSPIHVEKVPLGSNITVRWRLLTTAEFDFDLAECDLYLYYAAAGSGFRAATNYELSTENGYVLTWNFAAAEQVRFGLYSLLLDVRRNGAKIATLVKDDAFSLVHRKGSVFPDRIIDFESIVTTMGGGALYTLIDVNNDGYSTVYRSDGVTPAQVDDLIIYDGNLWYAIDGSDLPYIRGLRGDLDALGNTALGLSNRIEDLEGNVGELWLSAQEFGVRMSDAEGNIGQLTLTAREFAVRMSDAEGNIGQLTLTAQQFGVRMSDAEGNIGQLTLTSQLFDVRMSDVEGNVGELMLTSEEFGVRMTNAEGSIGQLSLTAEQFAVRMSDTEGNVSLLQQTASSLTSQIQDAQGNISTLQQTATSLTSRIQDAEGNISTIAQTAESIQLQVDNQRGDIAALEVSARAITSRVSDAEGNISILEQTATSLTSQIEDAEGNISTLQQTAASLTSQIQDAEGNISELQQTATQISSRVTSIEGEFGEGGRVTVAESTIVQQAGLIATKVSQTEYDENNQAISTHFSTIEQTASQISTRVAAVESEFGEGGRVTVAESTIVQQAGLIATKVSQTDYDANNQAISTRFSSIEQTAGEISASVTNVSNNLSSYEALTDAVLTNLQDQIDGVVETWYAEGEPTLSNYPVNTWEQADYPNHIGDLYYDKLTGKAYRFMLDDEQDPAVYVWVELADEDIAKALALAGEKRRVFVSTPYAPYDAGDLWVKERTVNGETTREIYRCKRSRAAGETIDLANDWVPADDYAVTVNYANLKILADAIVGEVSAFTYDSEGKISSASKSNITQTAEAIRLSVSNQAIGTALGDGGSINDALLDTGIDITNGDITLTANHIKLQNQSAISGLELVTIGSGADQRVVIDVSSLNVNGIFSTTAWSNKEQALQGYADSAAGDAYTDAVAQAATDAASYITTNVAPLITTAQNTADAAQTAADNAQSAVNGLGYLANALENGTTAIGGGLILSSLIGLGGNSGSGGAWELWSGVNGQYDTRTEEQGGARGHGIAAWFGGPMVDHLQYPSETNYAASLFRMDGSGYLAGGEIQWGASGELIIHGTSTENPISIENAVLTQGNLSVTISDLIALKSWFTVESWTDSSGTHNYLKLNASNTGLEGFVSDGFISAGGLSPGSGTGGADLPAVWTSLRNVSTSASEINNTIKINALHIPIGTGLEIQNGLIVATNSGTVTGVSLAAGATNGTLHLVVNGTAQSDVAVTGLGSMAYKSSLVASDIPNLSWNKITSDKPTTLGGYGITDAKFGTAGSDYIPITLGSTTKNVLTAHQSLSAYLTSATAASTYQPLDADLTSIAGLSGTSGFLKKTAANTWSLDTNSYGRLYTATVNSGKVIRITFNNQFNAIVSVRRTNGSAGLILAGNGYGPTTQRQAWAQISPYSIFTWSVPESEDISRAIEIYNPEGNPAYVYVLEFGSASPTFTEYSSLYTTGGNYPIANIYSNVASATKLQTARTIWGQSFDGSANVSGAMTGVTTITASGQVEVGSLKLANATPTLSWDASASAWKLTGNFYATGWVSAGGVSSSGGSGGIDADAMWGLLANTDSTKQINAAHLSTALSGYLPLTGGMLTSNGIPLVLNSQSSANYSALRFAHNGTNFVGIISYTGDGYLRRMNGDWSAEYIIYDSGNFVAGVNYQTPKTTLSGYGITDWVVKADSTNSPDTFTTPGIYRVSTQTGTSSFNYGNILVLRGGGYDTIAQVAFPYNNNDIYFRRGTTSNFTSDTWKTILNSANYTSYVNTTNFPGLNSTGTVTSITLTQGSGISITDSGTAITGSGTRTISLASTYAGGTAVTLNGTSKASSTASFYAPTTVGTEGQILNSLGSGAPAWTSTSRGASNKPIYLNSSGVLTEGVACLPLTGGTLKNGTSTSPLVLDTDSTSGIGLRMDLAGVQKAWVGYSTTQGAYLWNAASQKYLGIKDDGTPHYQGNTLWHAGNDGADSGLDADLLDGLHASSFVSRQEYTIQANSYVRISFSAGNYSAIVSVRRYNGGAELILIGNGYGANTIRNNWYQLSTSSTFSWSIPATDSISCSIEIYNPSGTTAAVYVNTLNNVSVSFATISAFTSAAVTNRAAYISDLTAGYLPLTGGTIKNGSATSPFSIDTDASGYVGMYLKMSGTSKAWIGYDVSYGVSLYNQASAKYLGIKDDGTPHYQGNTLYHSGNSNKSDVPWACSTLTASGIIHVKNSYINFENASGSTLGYIGKASSSTDHIYLIANSTLRLGAGDATDVVITGDTHYFGIGTTSPAVRLHISGSSGEMLRLSQSSNYTAGAGPKITFYNSGSEQLASISGVFDRASGQYANMHFGTRTSDALGVETKMTILYNGNVGIGTTSPTDILHVVGSARVMYGSSGVKLGHGGNTIDGVTDSGWANLHLNYYSTGNITMCNGGGSVIIGAAGTPAYKLEVSGGVGASSLALLPYYTRPSAAGWYTIYTSNVNDASSDNVIIYINRGFSNNNNEAYIVAVTGIYSGNIKFSQISGAANQQVITKIRVVYVASGAYIIQIYYSVTSQNNTWVSGVGTGKFSVPTLNNSPTGTAVEFNLQTAGIATSGNVIANGAITAGAASDRALKTNISTLSDSDAKALIMALRPVSFTWNDKATELYDQYKGNDLGFVAQEVENVLPVAIGTIFEKYKRLDQTKFIAPLVAVAKNHETRIEKLEKEVKARDARIIELESEVKRLRMN